MTKRAALPRRVAATLVATTALLTAACSSAPNSAPAADASGTDSSTYATGPATTIGFSRNTCGEGWSNPQPGQQTLVLTDTDTHHGDAYLTDAATGAVIAFVEPLSPGTKVPLSVNVGSGSYAFVCAIEDTAVITGPTVVVPGSVPRPVPAVKPVSQPQLIAPMLKYTKHIKSQIPQLRQQVATLRSDVTAGKRAKAERDWLAAHLTYESLGAAYGAFGDLDGAINGTAQGLSAGVRSKDFTGFHRLEYGLWHGEQTTRLLPVAAQLAKDVNALSSEFDNNLIDPLELTIRAHEIAENALQFELNGETNYGSNSNVATVAANLAGTKVALDVLRPLLTPRYPALKATYARLAKARVIVSQLHRHGTWPALSHLTRRERNVLNANIGQLTEMLAPVASILEPRITQ